MSDTGGTTEAAVPAPNTVLGLPVDTFAYILVGVGLGGAVLFIVIYCVAKAYCKCCCCSEVNNGSPRRRSNYKSVREIWELDTIKRKSDLESAGYSNEAFDNLEELSALSFHKGSIHAAASNQNHSGENQDHGKKIVTQSLSMDHIYKKKGKKSGGVIHSTKSSPANLPVLQVNGEAMAADYDQVPKTRLGSSLVRIEEEVITEEKIDVEKGKSKKKSKNSKKQFLSTELSSDGFAAEELTEPVNVEIKAVTPPGTLLTSVVVVHADNNMFQDGETGELLSVPSEEHKTTQTDSLPSVSTSRTESLTGKSKQSNENCELDTDKFICSDTNPLTVTNSDGNSVDVVVEQPVINGFSGTVHGEQTGTSSCSNDVAHDQAVTELSSTISVGTSNIEQVTTSSNTSEESPTVPVEQERTVIKPVTTQELSSSSNVVLKDSSVDVNTDTTKPLSDSENKDVMPSIIDGILNSENLPVVSPTIDHITVVETGVVLSSQKMTKKNPEDGLKESQTNIIPNGKVSNQNEPQQDFFNNNSISYSTGSPLNGMLKSGNAIVRNGNLITPGNPPSVIKQNGSVKTDNSDSDKLRSWLHGVYDNRSAEPSHL